MTDHSRSSTLLFNNQWVVVSMTTSKTKLPYSKPTTSTNMEVSSSLNVTSPNSMEIIHNVSLNGWMISTVTTLKGISTILSTKSLPSSKEQLPEIIAEEQGSPCRIVGKKDPSLLLLDVFKQMNENIQTLTENRQMRNQSILSTFEETLLEPAQPKTSNSELRRKESSTTELNSVTEEPQNASMEISSPITPATPQTTVVSASAESTGKFIRKRKQHSQTYASCSTVASPYKRINSYSEDDEEEEEEEESSSLPLMKRGISKLPKQKLIASTPNLSYTQLPQKRDRKNIVKNFIKAFRGFLSSPSDEQEAIEILSSAMSPSAAQTELPRMRLSLEKFLENKNYNNTLMVQLISNTDYTLLLHHFLTEKAPEWINQSKIKDKVSHEEALHHYLLSLKDSSALQRVRCLKYRTNPSSISASVLPDMIECGSSAAAAAVN